jgi:murein peptide amidase A
VRAPVTLGPEGLPADLCAGVVWAVMRRIAFIALACAACLSCASGHREPFTSAAAAVRDLAAFETDLRAAAAGGLGVSVTEAGSVSWERFESPMWVVSVDRPGALKRALVVAGIHGNEPAGASWAVELVRQLATDPSVLPDVSFDILPLLNPWGWTRDIRYDRDGRDINRDFATFATQEAHLFRDFVRGRRYDFAIDHHEDGSAKGFYVYQYADRDTRPTRRLIDRVRDLGFPIEQDVSFVILRTRDGLIRAPRWGLWYMKASRRLSLTNWLRLEGIPRVFTVETPTSLPIADRIGLHRAAFASLAADVLQGGAR